MYQRKDGRREGEKEGRKGYYAKRRKEGRQTAKEGRKGDRQAVKEGRKGGRTDGREERRKPCTQSKIGHLIFLIHPPSRSSFYH